MSDDYKMRYNPETGEWIAPQEEKPAEEVSAQDKAAEVASAEVASAEVASAKAQESSALAEEAPKESVEQIIRQAEETSSPYFERINEPEAAPAEAKKESKKAAKQKKQKAPKEPRQKKGMGFFGKAVAAVFLAVIFGAVAGGTFYGVCYYTGVWDKNEQQVENTTPVNLQLPDTETKIDFKAVPDEGGEIRLINSDTIQVISTDVSEMVEQVIPAMVTIVNTGYEGYDFWGRSYASQSSGTGVIVGQNDTELLIATNNHVSKDSTKLEITFVDGTTATAKVKGADAGMDLAVLTVALDELSKETKEAIVVAQLGDSDSLKLGQPAVVIGNALGIGISVTDGIISGLNREMTTEDGKTGTFIQTDAAVNHGNSGGALLNIKGEVIGIVSNKIDGESVEGMGYAIPISAASPIIAELSVVRTELVPEEEQGYLGVSLQTVTEEARAYYGMPDGAYIYNVVENSGAEVAGLRKGDVITKLEGITIYSGAGAREVLQHYRIGEEVTVKYSRLEEGEYVNHEVKVVLGAAPTK